MGLRSFCKSAGSLRAFGLFASALAGTLAALAQPRPFAPGDLWEWREIHGAQISPDGGEIVWAERRADPSSNIFQSRLWLVEPSGAAPRALTPAGARDTHPSWSPDGSRIAYLSDREGRPRIYVRAIASGTETGIAGGDAVPLTLAWSPDGRTVAYTARVAEPLPGASWAPPALLPQLRAPHTRLFLAPVQDSESRPVPLGALEPVGEPAWMPDSRALLLALAPPFDPEHLQGSAIYSLSLPDFTLRRLSAQSGDARDPLPSPDGSRIAWVARESKPQSYVTARLWVANPDGSRARVLAGALDRDPVQPAWSSDSRTLYFLADDRGQTRVWAARNDGSVRPVLSAARLHDFSLAGNGRAVAVRDPEELIAFPVDLAGAPAVLAAPNRELLAARVRAPLEAFEYRHGANTIQAWLTLPPGYDAGRRYPLLVVTDDAPRRMCGGEFRLREQVFAAAGLMVLCANARGAPGYGEMFGNLIRTGIPGDPFDDWMAGVDAAVAKGRADEARLAIAGGLSAAWAIGHTDRFHAAVALRPIVDFTLGGLFAGQFRTPTLVIAGDHDAAADELYFALRSRKVESALLRIGDERPGDRVLEWEALLGWLLKR